MYSYVIKTQNVHHANNQHNNTQLIHQKQPLPFFNPFLISPSISLTTGLSTPTPTITTTAMKIRIAFATCKFYYIILPYLLPYPLISSADSQMTLFTFEFFLSSSSLSSSSLSSSYLSSLCSFWVSEFTF